MTIRHIPILDGLALPHDANCWFAPYSNANGTSTQDAMVLNMSGTADSGLKGVLLLPQNYVGTPKVLIDWSSQTTGSNVFFEFRSRSMTQGTDAFDISTSPTEQVDSVTTSGKPGLADDVEEDTITLTAGAKAAGELMYWELWRQAATEAGDTLTASIQVFGAWLEYSDA